MQTIEHSRVAHVHGPTAADVPLSAMDNNSLIIRLHFTINHLSRWLTPIHDQTLLNRRVRRAEPSVKELLIRMRDEERRIFSKMHLISVEDNPDLDKLPESMRLPNQEELDRARTPLGIMAEFRRLRQSTCSLLRSLPDDAWSRGGISRRERDWTIRQLAEHLANHDLDVLYQIDVTLDRIGAREGVSPAARAHLDELLRLVSVNIKRA